MPHREQPAPQLVPLVPGGDLDRPSSQVAALDRSPLQEPKKRLSKEVYVPLSRVLNGEMDSQRCQQLHRRVATLEAQLAASHQREQRQRLEIAELRRRLNNTEGEARVYSL